MRCRSEPFEVRGRGSGKEVPATQALSEPPEPPEPFRRGESGRGRDRETVPDARARIFLKSDRELREVRDSAAPQQLFPHEPSPRTFAKVRGPAVLDALSRPLEACRVALGPWPVGGGGPGTRPLRYGEDIQPRLERDHER